MRRRMMKRGLVMGASDYVLPSEGVVYVMIVRREYGWEACHVATLNSLDWDVSFNVLLHRCQVYGWVVTNL